MDLIEARSELYSIIVEGLEVPSDDYAARLVSAIENMIVVLINGDRGAKSE